jgi:hypothetical protein
MKVYKGIAYLKRTAFIEVEARDKEDLLRKLKSGDCRLLEITDEPGDFVVEGLFDELTCDVYEKSDFDDLVEDFGHEAVDDAYWDLYFECYATDLLEYLRNALEEDEAEPEEPD